MPRLVRLIPCTASFPFFPTWILASPVSLDVSVAWSGQSLSGLGAFDSLSLSVSLYFPPGSRTSLYFSPSLSPSLFSLFNLFLFHLFCPSAPSCKTVLPPSELLQHSRRYVTDSGAICVTMSHILQRVRVKCPHPETGMHTNEWASESKVRVS